MQSFFEKLFDNLLVAAFVPSLGFFTTLVLLFEDFIPTTLAQKIWDVFYTPAILIMSLAICLSFVLSYLSETVYWIYRGSLLKSKFFLYPEKHRSDRLKKEIQGLEKQIEVLERAKDVDDPELKRLEIKKSMLSEYKQNNFPPDEKLLPTRFGNILAAAEYYPSIRYNINAEHMWPRLKQVIPPENMAKIDQVNHEMAFLVNSSLLSFFLGLFAWIGALYHFVILVIELLKFLLSLPVLHQANFIPTQIGGLVFFYILGLIFILSSWILYLLSIPMARRYAETYKCAFDLFRFQLSEQLRFGCPPTTISEHNHWAIIHAFLNSEEGAIPVKFNFKHNVKKSEQNE